MSAVMRRRLAMSVLSIFFLLVLSLGSFRLGEIW